MILEERRPILITCLPRSNRTNLISNSGFGGRDAQIEEFMLDARGSLDAVFLGDPLDQSDPFCGQIGTTAAIARFEFPE